MPELSAALRERLTRDLESRGGRDLLSLVAAHATGCLAVTPTDERPYARVGGHRLGGEPDLPPDFEWPRRTEEPFAGLAAFIAQIRLDALPAHGPLPRSGLL